MGKGDLNAAFIKHHFQAPIELATNTPLLQRARFEAGANDNGRLLKTIQTEYFNGLQHVSAIDRIMLHGLVNVA
jgi:hypothetical protein